LRLLPAASLLFIRDDPPLVLFITLTAEKCD